MKFISRFKLWWKPLDMSLGADYTYTPTNSQRLLEYENKRGFAESIVDVGIIGAARSVIAEMGEQR